MNEAGTVRKVEVYLKGLGYPAGALQCEYQTHRGKRIDLVVLYGGRVLVAFEVKRLDQLPQDENLFPFDVVVRQLQYAALEIGARFYVITDGNQFLWFETDKSGRPSRLAYPKNYDELTVLIAGEAAASDRLQVAKRAMRALLERSREQRWSPEMLPLMLFAYLQDVRGDGTFSATLMRITGQENYVPEAAVGLATAPNTWFAAIHAFVVEQDSTRPEIYEAALDILSKSGFNQLATPDALELLDEILSKYPAWTGVSRMPRWTSDLMVRIANIQQEDCVVDLNCGVGSLSAAMRLVGSSSPTKMTLYARHATEALWSVVQQLIFSGVMPEIIVGNPLVSQKDFTERSARPDCILVAPPFGVSIRDADIVFREGGALSSEEAYLLRALEMLSPHGKVVALLPNGSLSNPARSSLREVMLRNGLCAVLDVGAFLPGSGAAASIVVLDRSRARSNTVFFANAQNRQKIDRFDCRDLVEHRTILVQFEAWLQSNGRDNDVLYEAGLTATAVPKGASLNAGPYLARQAQLHLPLASFEHLPISRIAEVSKGAAIRRSKHSGDTAFIAPGAIRPLEINLDPLDRADEWDVAQHVNAVAREGDVVVNGLSTYIAAAALVEAGQFPINRHVFRLRADQRHVMPGYLAIAINSRYVRDAILELASGSVMKMLTLSILKDALVPVPPLPVQAEIVRRVAEARHLRDAVARTLQEKQANLDGLVRDLDIGDPA